MTTMLKKAKGTFTATGASPKVHGRNVQLIRSGSGVGTLQMRQYNPQTGEAIVKKELTANESWVSDTDASYDWDVNCSAHTSGSIEYYLVAEKQ